MGMLGIDNITWVNYLIVENHRIKFWGVRGSFPTPDRDKVEVGGHSSCVEIRTADNRLIIFDMGTGFIPCGKSILAEESPPKSAHVFISHFHWDHIIGYLGFPPFFCDWFTCNIYGKEDTLSIEEIFEHIHNFTFWPVEMPLYKAKFNLHTFPSEGVEISDSIKITSALHPHPNGANSYRLEIADTVIVYCTDEQLKEHKGWGHSSWQQSTALAKEANVKKLALFHHNPDHDDETIRIIEENAKKVFPNTIAAREGLEIIVPA